MFYTWPELKLNLKDYIFVPSAWYPWNHINERGSQTISFVETYSHLHTQTHTPHAVAATARNICGTHINFENLEPDKNIYNV
jgi:hypothetical protein